jgi:hypothetical protein
MTLFTPTVEVVCDECELTMIYDLIELARGSWRIPRAAMEHDDWHETSEGHLCDSCYHDGPPEPPTRAMTPREV